MPAGQGVSFYRRWDIEKCDHEIRIGERIVFFCKPEEFPKSCLASGFLHPTKKFRLFNRSHPGILALVETRSKYVLRSNTFGASCTEPQ